MCHADIEKNRYPEFLLYTYGKIQIVQMKSVEDFFIKWKFLPNGFPGSQEYTIQGYGIFKDSMGGIVEKRYRFLFCIFMLNFNPVEFQHTCSGSGKRPAFIF